MCAHRWWLFRCMQLRIATPALEMVSLKTRSARRGYWLAVLQGREKGDATGPCGFFYPGEK